MTVLPDHQASARLRLRAVHRAVAELRRGTPVLLAGSALAVLPAETAGRAGLRDLAAVAGGAVSLLLGPVRAAALQGVGADRPVALRVPPALLDPSLLRGLADPTAEQLVTDPLDVVPVPQGGGAAMALVKLSRLLPAVLVVPISAGTADGLGLLSVAEADVLDYPVDAAAGLSRVVDAHVPLEDAPDARLVGFRAPEGGIEHLAILIGRPEDQAAPLVRLHSECFTGDLLGSLRCDCGTQLRTAIRRMAAEGAGAVLYLAQEGRGIGLMNKLRAYALQDRGLDTLDANRALGWGVDERGFLIAATMLSELGLNRVRLLTNNPEKLAALQACGIHVLSREALVIPPNGVNDAYLTAKSDRMGHLL